MNDTKEYVAKWTNRDKVDGKLEDVIKDADVFIGVSVANLLSKEMVKSMADDPIIFAMANPDPEINPNDAKEAGAKVIGTGRSDFPNQINNVLAFPGIFRGALDVEATQINEQMKRAAVEAIADLIKPEELNPDYCIPAPFDSRVAPSVAREVAKAAMESGVARTEVDPEEIYNKTIKLTELNSK
jgi:malate dehydrogenase (oxaloacetate-decarboxylating)